MSEPFCCLAHRLGRQGVGHCPCPDFGALHHAFRREANRGTGGDAGYAVEPEQAQGTSSNAKASAKGEAVELRAAPADGGVALE